MAEEAGWKQRFEGGIIGTVALGIYISVPFCRTKVQLLQLRV